MGVDIYARSGVVATLDQMTAIISEDNREQACRALLRRTSLLLKSLRDDLEAEELDEYDRELIQREAGLLTTVCKSLNVDSSVDEIRAMLKNLNSVHEDGAYSYVRNSDEAINIWGTLIKELYPDAPVPESTVYITSPRYQGWDLPLEEILFVFSEDECFERTKTQTGLALDQMLEETTDLSKWTVYSV